MRSEWVQYAFNNRSQPVRECNKMLHFHMFLYLGFGVSIWSLWGWSSGDTCPTLRFNDRSSESERVLWPLLAALIYGCLATGGKNDFVFPEHGMERDFFSGLCTNNAHSSIGHAVATLYETKTLTWSTLFHYFNQLDDVNHHHFAAKDQILRLDSNGQLPLMSTSLRSNQWSCSKLAQGAQVCADMAGMDLTVDPSTLSKQDLLKTIEDGMWFNWVGGLNWLEPFTTNLLPIDFSNACPLPPLQPADLDFHNS